jgi:hypothetical protein
LIQLRGTSTRSTSVIRCDQKSCSLLVTAYSHQRGIDSSESTTVLIDIPPIWMKPWTMPDSFSANLLHDLKSISREFAVDRQTNHGEVASAAFDLVFNFRFGSISQLKFPVSVHKFPVLLDFFPVNLSWELLEQRLQHTGFSIRNCA